MSGTDRPVWPMGNETLRVKFAVRTLDTFSTVVPGSVRARIEQVYWTVGPYDIVAILDAPDDESATAVMLELGTAGNLRTVTLRAYDRDEMSGILQRLG